MQRTTLAIGVAMVLGCAHATEALAQEDEFEITLDVVLDDVEDVDGVVMSVIEDEIEHSERDEAFEEERELEARLRTDETFIDGDGEGADEFDDGQFDDYDDGEEIESGEHEDEPFGEHMDLDEPVDEVIEEPGMDEPVVDEPGIEEPGMDEPVVDEPGIEEPGMDEPVVDEPDVV